VEPESIEVERVQVYWLAEANVPSDVYSRVYHSTHDTDQGDVSMATRSQIP